MEHVKILEVVVIFLAAKLFLDLTWECLVTKRREKRNEKVAQLIKDEVKKCRQRCWLCNSDFGKGELYYEDNKEHKVCQKCMDTLMKSKEQELRGK